MINFACKRFDIADIIKCGLALTKADLRLIETLFNETEYLTTKQIAEKLNLDLTTIQKSVKRLFEKNILERKQLNLEKGGYTFIYKIRKKYEIKKILIDIIEQWSQQVKRDIQNW